MEESGFRRTCQRVPEKIPGKIPTSWGQPCGCLRRMAAQDVERIFPIFSGGPPGHSLSPSFGVTWRFLAPRAPQGRDTGEPQKRGKCPGMPWGPLMDSLGVNRHRGNQKRLTPRESMRPQEEIHLPAMSPFLPHGHQRLFMGWPWETEGKVHEAGRSPTVGSPGG